MTNRLLRYLSHTLAAAFVAVILCGVLPVAFWLSGPLVKWEAPRRAGAIVVLGGGVFDRESLGASSADRLLHGLRLFHRGYAPRIILTGGNPLDPEVPESEVMARVALDLGLSSSSLIVEREAARTATQGKAVARITAERNIKSVLVVTSPLHSYRASRVFEKVGLEVLSVPTRPPPKTAERIVFWPPHVLGRICALVGIVYEYGAIALYWWRGWI